LLLRASSNTHHKLNYKYFGPYHITERVGDIAYRLELPASSKIHHVVQVSQLRLVKSFKGAAHGTLPPSIPEFSIPLNILQTRGITKGNRLVQQVLVEWSELPHDLATWEDRDTLQQCFSFAPAWGQPGFQGLGNVTTPPSSNLSPREILKSGVVEKQIGRKRRANVCISGPEWV
jgi:hypothetical protein